MVKSNTKAQAQAHLRVWSLTHDKCSSVSAGGLGQPPLWSRVLIKISHFLLSLSSAANIVIYSAKVN